MQGGFSISKRFFKNQNHADEPANPSLANIDQEIDICILSPIFFLIVIDWVKRGAISDKTRGIQWTMFFKLEDLDFADDLAEISQSSFSKMTGLSVSTTRTKVMHDAQRVPNVSISCEGLVYVKEVTYLGEFHQFRQWYW